MNIQQAKEEIKKTVEVYLTKDKHGLYEIPVQEQRPVFMVGAPGIGKTAIMEQIAAELDIALVSYSMTHHTRQSALGLPYITKHNFDGEDCHVSEYTMSEILVSVHQTMERSGKKEGILFLDEINCVSETLAPAMLLFFQYKMFGTYKLPDGWVIVTAGNPPQYNRSVRQFDVATADRLKYMEVQEDFSIWKAHASESGIHPAILSFLEVNKEWFYVIESSVDGNKYVTARGWSDLSKMICMYEAKGFEITLPLVSQYLHHEEIARKFNLYYNKFLKFKDKYSIDSILQDNVSAESVVALSGIPFDEQISFLGIIMDTLKTGMQSCVHTASVFERVLAILKQVKKTDDVEVLKTGLEGLHEIVRKKTAAHNLSKEEKSELLDAIDMLEGFEVYETFKEIKTEYDKKLKKYRADVKASTIQLDNAFKAIESIWGSGQIMVLFVAELTTNRSSMLFISEHGCEKYYQYNKTLLVVDRKAEIKSRIKRSFNVDR